MKAILQTRYGPPAEVLEVKEITRPAPRDDGVLVEVHAAAINYSDWGFVRGKPFATRLWSGLLKPKGTLLGADIAGRVAAVGESVTQFRPGDEVFGDIALYGWGGFAEYVAVPENALALKPRTLTFAEAAAVPQAAIVALQGLRHAGQIRPGQKVLINGASGGIGVFAVQIAKQYGAEVTGVCSTRNLELVRSIGADHVIDYTREDFTRNGQQYDVIVATAGYRWIFDYRRALRPQGVYVATGGAMPQVYQAMFLGPLVSMLGPKKLGSMGMAATTQEDLQVLRELIEAGKVKPIIDRQYPLEEIAEALAYYGKGHTQGKVVIIVKG
ncbi:MAG: NAD(P)-dependent alcohol dehydrogenase [Anaerolineae bacterium]|nr:NAD(P)-dependent alcohol dehydrogenase [Anaerolineae bacterium]